MFLDLFYGLRDEGVPVGMQEWMMLMDALGKGLHGSDLMSFYNISRACLVKSETYFDHFDRVFARVFHGVEGELSVSDELMDWLSDAVHTGRERVVGVLAADHRDVARTEPRRH